MPAARGADALLAFQLRAPIGVERRRGVILAVWTARFAAEYVIGGVMNEQRAYALRLFREDAWGHGVDGGGEPRFRLRFVDRRIRGGIDDDVRTRLANVLPQGMRV